MSEEKVVETQTKTPLNMALEHLSHSRMNLWRRDRKGFHSKYILEIPTPDLPQFVVGRRVDAVVAGETPPESDIERKLAPSIEKVATSSRRAVSGLFKHKGKDYTIVGEVDLFDHHTKQMVEIKSVKDDPYNIRNIIKDARSQLALYHFTLKQAGEEVSDTATIRIVKKKDGEPTGDIEDIPVVITENDTKKTVSRMSIFVNEVTIAYGEEKC